MPARRRRGLAVLLAGPLLVGTAGAAGAQDPVEVETAVIVDAHGRPIDGGGSATPFTIDLPDDAECQGDSANDGYRVNSYLVPASLAPQDVTYDGLGPTPNAYGDHASFRQPLYDTDTTFFVSVQLLNNEERGRPGRMQPLPAFDFGVYAPGQLPAGAYRLGIACTLDNAVTRAWDARIEVREDPSDAPAGITWSTLGRPQRASTSGAGARPIALAAAVVAAAVTVLLLRRRSPARSAPLRRNP